MNEPVRLRIRPLSDVDGMQFTGVNTSQFMEWVRQNDATIEGYTVHHDYPTVGHHLGDGSRHVPVSIPYLVIFSRTRDFRLYANQWILRSPAGFLSVHNNDDIHKKYEVVLP